MEVYKGVGHNEDWNQNEEHTTTTSETVKMKLKCPWVKRCRNDPHKLALKIKNVLGESGVARLITTTKQRCRLAQKHAT